ncbi:MAG TPA: hypothetical protein VGQ42_02385 [Candidatus Dormibacteraeota bacterium]|nr:hypothetical protein [Candidatus Dormibacteraeota bacterium]
MDQSDPAVRELRRHPVRTTAEVTGVLVDGFGGEPTVDYGFQVDGHSYTGSGTGGELGNGDVLHLKPGEPVAVEYAAGHPSASCTCDAARADDWRMPYSTPAALGIGVESVLLLGLFGLAVVAVRGILRSSRPSLPAD